MADQASAYGSVGSMQALGPTALRQSTLSNLPDETLLTIVHCSALNGKDLKAMRLTNRKLKHIVTPLLFNAAWLSITEENLENLKNFGQAKHLSQHARTLYVDATSYHWRLTTYEYSKHAAAYFNTVLDKQFSGVFTPESLHSALTSPKIANGTCRTIRQDFVNGYVSYHARSEYYHQMIDELEFPKFLEQHLPAFGALREIVFLQAWQPAKNSSQAFNTALGEMIPEKDSIGLDLFGFSTATGQALPTLFVAPGPTARQLPGLYLPPLCPSTKLDREWRQLFYAVLKVVWDNDIGIQGLDLLTNRAPRSTPAEGLALPRSALPISVLRSARYGPNLKEFFSGLRTLELAIDPSDFFAPTGGLQRSQPDILAPAIQHLRQIECLSLTFHCYKPPTRILKIWTVRDLFLTAQRAPERLDSVVKTKTNDDRRTKSTPWPKLKILKLSGLRSTPEDLISVLGKVAPTLDHFTLHDICLPGDSCTEWSALGLRMHSTLALKSCNIILPEALLVKNVGLPGFAELENEYGAGILERFGEPVMHGTFLALGAPVETVEEKQPVE